MTENLNKNLRGEPSQKVLETLLKAASAKLGTDPETLRRSLENGSLEKSIKNAPADSEGMKKLKQALSDPKTARQLMNDPRAAEILKRAGGK